MSDWVIEHTGRLSGLEPLYWNGADNDQHPPWTIRMAFVPLEQAARFISEEAALQAFRGDYRPAESCCQAVQEPESPRAAVASQRARVEDEQGSDDLATTEDQERVGGFWLIDKRKAMAS